MNITWKIFFSSVLTMTITFCTAGYILIFIFFESGYKQSVNSAIDLSSMFLQTFGNYMVNEQDGEEVEEAVGAIANNMLKENVRIYIEDEKGKSVYTDAAFEGKEQQLERGDAKGISYILTKEGTEYYIRVSNQIQVGDVWYYAWTDHNVTNLFTERENEIWIYNQFLVWIVLINGVISWTLARFIVHPIRKISQGAERIAGGDLDYRLSIRNHDEIGNMAINFNRMADSLAGEIAKLEDIAERQEEFIGSFAHELKTPVSSIQGYLETIVSNENIPREKINVFLERCYAQSNRLSRLLRDISVLTRMDEAANMIDMEKVDISMLVSNIVNEVSLELEQKQITVVNSLKPKIQLRGNYSLLYSIFRNLMDNAIAYAGTNIHINISCFREDENYYYFSFADTGIGVSPEHLNRLFERFYRVDKGRSRKLGGTGLGLAIVKNAVLIHGGTISAKNNQGGGLEFVFTLAKER